MRRECMLVELDPSHPKYKTAVAKATSGRCILEFMRVGTWKCRVVVRGYEEDKLALDGPNLIYAANVCELASVRNLLFTPRECPHGAASGSDVIFSNTGGPSATDDDPIVIAQCDVATADFEADKFAPNEPGRFLKLKDPVTGTVHYFWQRGNLYGSSSAGVRWERTLNAWLTGKDVGFEQGKKEPCAFRHV